MARRVTLPESRLKRRKRVRRVRLLIALSVLLLLLLGIVIGLSWVPFIRIHMVEVRGTETIATSTLEEFVNGEIEGKMIFVLPKNNIFLYPKQNIISKLLARYPTLKGANVRAQNFETIGVEVAERKPRALWCGENKSDGDQCYLMDETGFAYAEAPAYENAPYVRYFGAATTTEGFTSSITPKQFLTAENFAALLALVDALAAHQKNSLIKEAEVDSHSDVYLAFSNGFTLIFSLKDAKGDVFERFTLALASGPFLNKSIADFEYLDLRFGDKLYYRER